MKRGGKGPKEEQVGALKGREKKRKYPGKVERYSGKEEGEKIRRNIGKNKKVKAHRSSSNGKNGRARRQRETDSLIG
jgi:hypothetical protein